MCTRVVFVESIVTTNKETLKISVFQPETFCFRREGMRAIDSAHSIIHNHVFRALSYIVKVIVAE